MSVVVFAALVLSVLITYWVMPAVIKLAETKKLFDTPNYRKVHVQPIPSLGGLALFVGTMLPCMVALQFFDAPYFTCLLCAMTTMVLFGVQDDLIGITPGKKLLGQALAALLVIISGNVTMQSAWEQLFFTSFPVWANWALSAVCIVAIINAYNLIDGVDGLAGTLGSAVVIVLGYFFLKNDLPAYATLCFCLSGSLIAFLAFNLQPARIFMGDTGSLLVGLICAIAVMKFIEVAPKAAYLTTTPSLALGLALIWLPSADMLRVFMQRLSEGRSPFRADKKHLHHLLLAKGVSHRAVAPILLIITSVLVTGVYLLRHMAVHSLILVLTTAYLLVWLAVMPRMRQSVAVDSTGVQAGSVRHSKAGIAEQL